MSIPYERLGRVNQKSRTRTALIAAARALLEDGSTPTVEQAAAHAAVSRPTAYRYFRNQHELLSAAHPELRRTSLLPSAAPEDPVKRLDLFSAEFMRLLLKDELALRAMWRLSLEEKREPNESLVLRTGRRITWVEDALAPLKQRLGRQRFRKLVLAIGATLGIEPLIWLVDIAHMQRKEAVELLRSSARSLLREAL